MNRKTVHRAYRVLADEGMLDVRPGAGTYVARSLAPHGHDALMHAVNRCRTEARSLGLSPGAFADFVHSVLNGGLAGLPIVVSECNREQIDMIGRDLRSGLGIEARPVLLENLVANPTTALAGAWGVVTTDCHRAEVEAAVRTVGLPVYRVALDPEFPQAILRWARTRGVVITVGDERFAGVFVRFLGQLGAPPEVAARVRVVPPSRLRAALAAAGEDPVVLVSPLSERDAKASLPAGTRPVSAHWRLAEGTLDRLRAELAYDLAARREGHA